VKRVTGMEAIEAGELKGNGTDKGIGRRKGKLKEYVIRWRP